MAKAAKPGSHAEAEQGDEAKALAKAGLFCLAISVLFILGGFYGLGRRGMLEVKSPDFAPVPHFLAFAALCLSLFFFIRAYLHGRRYRLFGTSVLDAPHAVLGETFGGTLRIAKTNALTNPIALRLRCDWRYHRSDVSNRSSDNMTTEHLWEQIQEVPFGTAALGVPFRFALPEDGLPSGRRPKPRNGVNPGSPGDIVWTLRASSPRWGVDYVAEFEVDVRPGQAIRSHTHRSNPDAAPSGLADRISRPLGAIAEAGAFLLGGSIPTTDELREQAEADAREEPTHAFADSAPPEQDGARLFRIASLIVCIALSLIAGLSLLKQATFGWHGTDVQTTIVRVENHAVTLNLGTNDPEHKIYVSSLHRWTPGQDVVALCEPGDNGQNRCRMQSRFDRWLDGLGVLGVALLAFGFWNYLRRKSGAKSVQSV